MIVNLTDMLKGNLVNKDTDSMVKGDYMPFERSDGTVGIIYCCPQCGEVSAGTDNHILNMETESCKHSLVHKCGFHKTLTNGNFI